MSAKGRINSSSGCSSFFIKDILAVDAKKNEQDINQESKILNLMKNIPTDPIHMRRCDETNNHLQWCFYNISLVMQYRRLHHIATNIENFKTWKYDHEKPRYHPYKNVLRKTPTSRIHNDTISRHTLANSPCETSPITELEKLTESTLSKWDSSTALDQIFGIKQISNKRRKSRTAFSSDQLTELERRFSTQKYLTPADRDDIANKLNLTAAQVITWFQNRRAKLKRDVEEMKNDLKAISEPENEKV